MNQPPFPTNYGVTSRSIGLKLIVICALALVMTLPSFFVDSLVTERTRRRTEVTREISDNIGGPQTFLGPTLAVPYTEPAHLPATIPTTGIYLIYPEQAAAAVKTTTSERHRSLYRVPVFQADLQLNSNFNLASVPTDVPLGAKLDWSRAEVLVGVSDTRGAQADPTLSIGSNKVTLTPTDLSESISVYSAPTNAATNSKIPKLHLLSAKLADLVEPGTSFRATSTLKFSGAEHIAVLPYGKTTRVTVEGDWPNPGFDGATLPVTQTISQKGFRAEWFVPYTARGLRSEGPVSTVNDLSGTSFGLSFVEVADAYQSVNRSLKYVLLILGLVFLTYFVFEVTTGKRLHPAQYVLVGTAQIIFYLLLLSLSERIGFDAGFLLAAIPTVLLFSLNAGWVFASRRQLARAFAVFSTLYSVIYLLLRLEDNALLLGALSSFVAVALAMYFTKGLDWYGTPEPSKVS